ncbi:uncharacterized protein TRIADDRAFT_60456 [Trichoplax adhaerens]|uniref:Enoyl reductase (ER) domain-containing protein n=1 Tax=Trichoplax adhaerens TaxID=10228 RepID=B3S895_TRIAD|nr:hypothetical protein TRIADDRAFT_60456 [Trichoplax adhaerens]EDV21161.1 hypothetical protein TRIADDRAFT_60456 [Trichoplax adhaerens]|eukprot:XP_002116491.1 hypothetical protein TRIADDRAFT_60456 [Trichoplax adhaerens]
MIPKQIEAYVIDDASKQTFRKSQIDVPQLQPLDVLMNIECCSVCHTDFYCPAGKAPGHEFIGKIVAIGSSVEKLKVGQRVGGGWQLGSCQNCNVCNDGKQNICLKKTNFRNAVTGGFADYVVWDSRFLYDIPETMSSADAAPLLCAGITVYAPLANHNVQPGSRVGILGVGGLGHLGIKFAKAWGCRVVALSTSSNKEKEARAFGADEFVVTKDADQLKSLKPLDMIINTVSANLDYESYINLLAPRGKFVVVGIASKPLQVNGGLLIGSERSIVGSLVGSPIMMQKMLNFAGMHNISPQLEIYPMDVDHCHTAFERIDQNLARYRIVLTNSNFKSD